MQVDKTLSRWWGTCPYVAWMTSKLRPHQTISLEKHWHNIIVSDLTDQSEWQIVCFSLLYSICRTYSWSNVCLTHAHIFRCFKDWSFVYRWGVIFVKCTTPVSLFYRGANICFTKTFRPRDCLFVYGGRGGLIFVACNHSGLGTGYGF